MFCINSTYQYRLTGISPFAAPTIEGIIENNEKCEITYPADLWANVSEEAKNLVMQMTQRDPEKRVSIQDALKHKWFFKDLKTNCVLLSALENMRKYAKE